MSSEEENREEWNWLALASHGDHASFRCLVERYQGRLLNFFLRSGAQDIAEDLVQETFVRLYRHRRRARPLARFTTYVHTLAHHAWIDYLRKRGRVLRVIEAVERELPDYDAHSSGHAAARLDAEQLLNTLSADLRATVVLVVYQGLSHTEAAEVLSIPVGTVKSRMFHSLHRMRAILERGVPDTGHET